MEHAQKRLIRNETVIASCLCSVLPSLAVYFLFEPFPVPIWGSNGLVAFAAKSTGVAVFLMTSLMTLGTRAKVTKGAVPRLPRERFGWLAHVPRLLPMRALVFALVAVAVLTGTTALFVLLVAPEPLGRGAFVAFNLVIGALTGLLMTPLIQCAALADAPRGSALNANSRA